MFEIAFTAADWSMDASGTWLRLKAESASSVRCFLDTMKSDKKHVAAIKEWRQKRSLDANAYCWVLLNKLADKLNMPVTDLYRHYIPDVPDNSQIVCVPTEAVEKLRKGWEHNGIGWCSDTLESKIPGCTNVVLYYGSSTFDGKQMSRLIELIVTDCKSLGIETMTPEELTRLGEEWGA